MSRCRFKTRKAGGIHSQSNPLFLIRSKPKTNHQIDSYLVRLCGEQREREHTQHHHKRRDEKTKKSILSTWLGYTEALFGPRDASSRLTVPTKNARLYTNPPTHSLPPSLLFSTDKLFYFGHIPSQRTQPTNQLASQS